MYVIEIALTAITTIDGPAPAGPVIRADALARLHDQSDQRARWMAQAQTERDAALAEREQARHDVQALRETWLAQAREQAGQEAAAMAEAARHDTVTQAVEWLVGEAALEREIVHSLERRVADAMAVALANFVEAMGVGERYALRVARALPDLVREGALTLRVPPAHLDAVARALRAADIVMACAPDPALSGRQARIESEWVTVCLDLDADLAAVMTRLRPGPGLEVAYG